MSAAAHASAARTRPYVLVHLTPYAPGCEDLDCRDVRRWRTFWSKRAVEVVRSLLTRLQRAPRDVTIEDGTFEGEILIRGRLAIGDDHGPILAVVCIGLDRADVRSGLDALAEERWRPREIPFSSNLARSAA